MSALAAALLLASEAGGHAPTTVWGLDPAWWHAINVAIAVVILAWFVPKGLKAAQAAKRERVRKGIEEAAALRAEMRAKFEDYDSRMKTIDERMAALVAEARDEARSEKGRLVGQADALAARIREDAKLIADQEIARAKRELQDEQAAAAAALAELTLKAAVTPEDQARLRKEFLGRVGAGGPAGGSGLPPGEAEAGPQAERGSSPGKREARTDRTRPDGGRA